MRGARDRSWVRCPPVDATSIVCCPVTKSADDDAVEIVLRLGPVHVESLQRPDDDLADEQVSKPLSVGRYDVPGRMCGTGSFEHRGERGLIVVPEESFVEVTEREFPVLVGFIETVLQPLPLLVLRDVKEQLHDRRSFVDEHLLEGVDVGVAPLPPFGGNEVMDTNDEHIFVVRAIERS